MKRFVTAFLAFCFVCSLLPATAFSEEMMLPEEELPEFEEVFDDFVLPDLPETVLSAPEEMEPDPAETDAALEELPMDLLPEWELDNGEAFESPLRSREATESREITVSIGDTVTLDASAEDADFYYWEYYRFVNGRWSHANVQERTAVYTTEPITENRYYFCRVSGSQGLLKLAEFVVIAEPLPQLAAPSELKWITESDVSQRHLAGSISYQINAPWQGYLEYVIYREGEAEPYCVAANQYRGELSKTLIGRTQVLPLLVTLEEGPETGNYTFRVRTRGDDIEYFDSEWAVSPAWHYDAPENQLGVASGLRLENNRAVWTYPAQDRDYVCGGMVEFYFSETRDGEARTIARDNNALGMDLTSETGSLNLYEYDIAENGSGYYSFRVKMLSRDITQFRNGQWSEMSEPVYISTGSDEVNDRLQQILSGTEDRNEIRRGVQDMDASALKLAMDADLDNTGVVHSLEALDEKAGGTQVIVSDSVRDQFPGNVKAIGAALNDPANDTEPVQLVVDRAKWNDVLPTLYNSTLAVRFSMSLGNIRGTDELAVPVKVLLPVPQSINREFLSILHYHVAGGEPEIIHPHCFYSDGIWYAAFTLTSFSDFVFVVPKEAEPEPDTQLVTEYVKRCYTVIMNREADADGVVFWTERLVNGDAAGADIVSLFCNSEEFRNKNLPNREIVTILYNAMLGRGPDADGLVFWEDLFNKGVSCSLIISGFVNSEEFRGICAEYGINPGAVETEVRDQNPMITAFVSRCYQYAMGRQGDAGGLNHWSGILLNHIMTPQEVSFEFLGSAEFKSMGLNNNEYIKTLYRLYMDRDADAGGLDYWLSQLENGVSRETAAQGFALSAEFTGIVQSYGLG